MSFSLLKQFLLKPNLNIYNLFLQKQYSKPKHHNFSILLTKSRPAEESTEKCKIIMIKNNNQTKLTVVNVCSDKFKIFPAVIIIGLLDLSINVSKAFLDFAS